MGCSSSKFGSVAFVLSSLILGAKQIAALGRVIRCMSRLRIAAPPVGVCSLLRFFLYHACLVRESRHGLEHEAQIVFVFCPFIM